MVIVRLNFGLGNQMFQYAAARALSLRYNLDFKVDLSAYEKSVRAQAHEKESHLHVFTTKLNLASKNEQRLVDHYLHSWPYRIYNKIKKVVGLPPAFTYFGNNFSPFDILTPNKRGKIIYLEGDFQNEAFFKDYAEVIRKEFSFKEIESDKLNYTLGLDINSKNSVSIHVRRGDYVNSNIIKPAATLYFQQAIDIIRSKVPEPCFYVFSDDIAWCRVNLGLQDSCFFMEHNTEKNSYKDMYLMSQCKHNIIANSSFSWWGAWLNNNTSKVVIAPHEWMPTRSGAEVVPASWIIV